jgi:anti-sigma B factor antagonist
VEATHISPLCERVRVLAAGNTLRTPVDVTLRHTVALSLCQGDRSVILDLGRLDHLDAGGIGELMVLFTSTRSAGGVFRIARPRPRIRRLLEVTGVFELLDAASTFATAAAQLR